MEIEEEEKETINNSYIIIERKGKGLTSIVYLAEDQTNKKKYAIKVLKKKEIFFQNELEIMQKVSSLKSPYIINLIESGEGPVKKRGKPQENKQYFVLEYAEKGELFNYIHASEKGLKEKYAKLIFRKILEGVQACHNADICHRDLKMQNILLDEFYNPKICDFGFATDIKGKDGSGKLKEYLGTDNYAAPEIHMNRPYNGIKADIFCLGVILINLVTGKPGFFKAFRFDPFYKLIMIRHFKLYWESVENQLGEMSDEFKNLYIKMVSFNPDERPTIDKIFKDPWMKEIMDLNGTEYKALEEEVFKEFQKLEEIKNKKNEEIEAQTINDDEIKIKCYNKGGEEGDEYEIKYFSLDLTPKYALKTGLNMNNYIKIKGELNPCKFMNRLANKIKSEFKDICEINENKEKLKFDVTFLKNLENIEVNESEDNTKWEEELDKLCPLDNIEEYENTIERKNNIIQIKLFESVNGGYIVRFVKKGGEIEEYNQNLEKIIKIIKEII